MAEPHHSGPGERDLEVFVDALAAHVPFDGWSRRAIEKARTETNLAADKVSQLPATPVAAIRLWSDVLDRRMLVSIEGEIDQVTRVRDKIVLCVRRRIELMTGQQEAARRATVVLAMPQNGPAAAGCLHRTVDRIWYAAGDASTDHNYYTKRGLLAPVYAATLLYWLGDSSEGQHQSWSFLERRIDNVMKLPGVLASLRGRLPPLSNPMDILHQFRDRRPWTYRG